MAPVISEDESEQTPIDLENEVEDDFSDIGIDDEDEELERDLDAMIDNNQDDEVPSLSEEEEDNYRLEDPDDIEEDLELNEEENDDEVTKPPPVKKFLQQPPTRRKRAISYYEQDNQDDDEATTPKPKPVKRTNRNQQPQDLDPDLILTDEETEYNPDNHLNRLTERQRRNGNNDFVQLSNDRKQKKETEEQAAIRKAENARRRLDYKNKQLEEEKQDTLNKLLKRRAVKVRDNDDIEAKDDSKHVLKPRRPMSKHPGFLRYVNNTTTLNGDLCLSFNV